MLVPWIRNGFRANGQKVAAYAMWADSIDNSCARTARCTLTRFGSRGELGASLEIDCELVDALGTVRVSGKSELFEHVEGSCGGTGAETSTSDEILVPAGRVRHLFLDVPSNEGSCQFPPDDCDDTAQWRPTDPGADLGNVTMENMAAQQ